MPKRFSLLLLSLGLILVSSPKALANQPNCWEFYEDGNGQRICLDNGRPVQPPSLPHYVNAVTYLDHLKQCQPVATAMAFPFGPGIVIESVVRGGEGDRCVVQMNAFLAEQPQKRAVYGLCRYRRSTIALLTDARAYEQARTGNITFSTNDPRDMTLSNAMGEDCQFSRNWLERLAP
ncbi:hypothetical protein VB712_16000 [Spirulina sp. CCNP1310]|uniref:hypothetical protein n=1 Tax=Spirulina sp. CCNP1310 TaxID=3110249 RepID=UPI002B1EB665|nr:hypothetical protein [Spirulina sp. CCNP1310]MEA5420735.1 hypothetical protein [Spirulina sp. CCNP1310]